MPARTLPSEDFTSVPVVDPAAKQAVDALHEANRWWANAPAAVLDCTDERVRALVVAASDVDMWECEGLWEALASNPTLDAQWWAWHGLNLAAVTYSPVYALEEISRKLGPRLWVDAELTGAMLGRLATPGAFVGDFPLLPEPDEAMQDALGAPARDWLTLAVPALAGDGGALWNASMLDDDLLDGDGNIKGAQERRAVWAAVMATYRSGLLDHELDAEDFAAQFGVEATWLGEWPSGVMASLWPEVVSVQLLNDDGWRMDSPAARWAADQIRDLLRARGQSVANVPGLLRVTSEALGPGACVADLVVSVGDLVARQEVVAARPARPGRSARTH